MSTANAKVREAWALGAVCVLVSTGSVACASSGFKSGIYTDPELGYSIPDPNTLAVDAVPVWSRVSIDGTDLAFRKAEVAYLALSSHCDEKETRPAVLGRQLLVGLRNREVLAREEFEFAGGHAIRQSVESLDEAGERLHTRTVTLILGDCVVDWLLIGKGTVAELEVGFDDWWRAFDPGRMTAAPFAINEDAP